MGSPSEPQSAASTRMLERPSRSFRWWMPHPRRDQGAASPAFIWRPEQGSLGETLWRGDLVLGLGCVLYQYRFLQNALGRGSISRPRDYSRPSVRSQLDEPLVQNAPDESYHSPLRADDRPMDGVFHATLVCARLADFNRAWLNSGLAKGAERESQGRPLPTICACSATASR